MSKVAAGVDTDDYGESLNEVETVLNKVGISLRDTEGDMRDLDDVLGDVANMWDKLSTVQQNQISTSIAGTRQANTFKTLMLNYADAMDLAAEATDSAGTAAEKYATYTDSLDAKINNIKASFSELAETTVNSEMVGWFIDLGNAILKVSNFLGGIAPVLVSILSVITIIKAHKIAKGTIEITNATKGLNKAISTIGTTLSTVLGVLGIIASVISSIVTWIKNAQAAAEEARQEAISAAQETQEAVRDLKEEYIELYNTMDKNSEDAAEKLSKSWDELYKLANKYRIEVDTLNDSYEYYLQLSGQVETAAARRELELTKKDYKKAQKYLNSDIGVFTYGIGDTTTIGGNVKEVAEKLKDTLDDYVKTSLEQGKDYNTYQYQKLASYYEELVAKIQEAEDTSNEYLLKQKKAELREEYEAEINQMIKLSVQATKLNAAQSKKTIQAIVEQMKEDYPEITSYIDEIANEYIDGIQEIIDEIPEAITNASDKLKQALSEEETLYNEAKEDREQQLELEEKILAVQEKQKALAEAERKRVKVYRAGKGFVYESDFAGISDAQKELTDAKQELEDYKAEIKFDTEEEAIDDLNDAFEKLFKNDEKFKDFVNSLGLSTEDLGDTLESMTAKLKSVFSDYLSSIGITNIEAYKALFGGTDVGSTNIGEGADYFETHHSGGVVGEPGATFTSGSLKNDEILAKLQKGETVLTQKGKNNLIKNFMNQGNTETITVGNISLPNVTNAEQFVSELKSISRMSLQRAATHR